MEKIILFNNELSNIIDNENNSFHKRINKNNETKLDFKNTVFSCTLLLNNSADNVVSRLEVDNIVTVSKNALIKKRNEDKTLTHIKNMNNNLLNLFYNKIVKQSNFCLDKNKTALILSKNPDKKLFVNNTNKRFIGCDGTQLNVCKSAINNKNIKPSKSNSYGTILISSFYDILNNIPISYHLIETNGEKENKKADERPGFLQQIDTLTNNDIVVFDRLYYSYNLVKKLNDKEIGYIFRMKNKSKLFKDMGYGKSKIVKVNNTNVQLFRYKIKNETYNILTSILDNISIGEIKGLYWKRWQIETDNRKFKNDIVFNNLIRSKKYNSISIDIESIKFISIVASIIEYINRNECPQNKKINSKNCIQLLYHKLLYLFLYDNKNHEKILKVIGIIYKKLIPIILGRSYERRRVRPSTKWNENGNRYGNGD